VSGLTDAAQHLRAFFRVRRFDQVLKTSSRLRWTRCKPRAPGSFCTSLLLGDGARHGGRVAIRTIIHGLLSGDERRMRALRVVSSLEVAGRSETGAAQLFVAN